jgi:type II secretory ATPase GspE/PulE/Tfp pilus assembly ATPase PilB-like protein
MPKHHFEALAIREGMQTLNQQAMDQAQNGVLPISEVIRVLTI